MKELPDKKIMLEMLEVIKEAEQKARELCKLSTAFALKCQKIAREFKETKPEQSSEKTQLINVKCDRDESRVERGDCQEQS